MSSKINRLINCTFTARRTTVAQFTENNYGVFHVYVCEEADGSHLDDGFGKNTNFIVLPGTNGRLRWVSIVKYLTELTFVKMVRFLSNLTLENDHFTMTHDIGSVSNGATTDGICVDFLMCARAMAYWRFGTETKYTTTACAMRRHLGMSTQLPRTQRKTHTDEHVHIRADRAYTFTNTHAHTPI